MDVKEIAKTIFTQVVDEGKKTDFWYHEDFYIMAKNMSKNRAAKKYEGQFLKEIEAAIELL